MRVSRSKISSLEKNKNPVSIGASYTWVDTLENSIIGTDTKRIVMYHSRLTSLNGLEKSNHIDHAYLGFNFIRAFLERDSCLTNIDVLDLAGNPLTSLLHCPPCKELIVSSTLLTNVEGCPSSVKILRIGHSTHLRSLSGLEKTNVEILECSCAPSITMEENKQFFPPTLKEFHNEHGIYLFEKRNVIHIFKNK